jgi:hypothetical protein
MNTFAGMARTFCRLASALVLDLLLSSCATMQPQDFNKSSTRFELDRYFVGHARSWGVFEDTNGNPRRSFICDSYGKRDAKDVVLLHQEFKFSEGKTQTRDWHIRRVDATHWEATANDMVGTACGEGMGNAFYWEYAISLNLKNPLATVHVRQWMYLAEGTDSLMTRLVITKLGIKVSEVTEVIHHVPDAKWSRE